MKKLAGKLRFTLIRRERNGTNKKCPKCGKGTMKAVANTVPLHPDVPRKEMQAACDECGYQDDFTKFYPIGQA
jgi:C4-type Zn-finger protein